MSRVKATLCSVTREPMRAVNNRVLLPMAALFLICSAGSSLAQIDPSKLVDRNSSSPQTVSKNALLAPRKALRAIEQAHKDIIDGHLDSAQKEIARALYIDPHFAIAEVMQAAIDLERKDYQGAAILFQQAIEDDPALGGAYVGLAVVLMQQGRFAAALPLLDRAEGLLPGAWFVHFAKAWGQLESGNTVAALKQADDAERIAGVDSEKRSGVSYLRGVVLIHMNDLEFARKQLAEAVAHDPGGQYASLAKRELEQLPPPLLANR